MLNGRNQSINFSNSLNFQEMKGKKISTANEAWKCDLNRPLPIYSSSSLPTRLREIKENKLIMHF